MDIQADHAGGTGTDTVSMNSWSATSLSSASGAKHTSSDMLPSRSGPSNTVTFPFILSPEPLRTPTSFPHPKSFRNTSNRGELEIASAPPPEENEEFRREKNHGLPGPAIQPLLHARLIERPHDAVQLPRHLALSVVQDLADGAAGYTDLYGVSHVVRRNAEHAPPTPDGHSA